MNAMPGLDANLSRRALLRSGALLGAAATLPWARAFAAAPEGWPQVSGLIERYVAERRVPGMIAAVGWRQDQPTALAKGTQGFDDPHPVTPQSLFRVYSMTKLVTGLAVMMLIDEGKLALDGKLADLAPEFAAMRLAIDAQASLDSRPTATPITIRHLLTHTAGLGYAGISRNKVGEELLRLGVVPAAISHRAIPGFTGAVPTPGADEFLRRAASVPLVAEPGTRWRYSMAYDVLGILVGRITGKPLGAFLHERLFAAAGMDSSFFRVPPALKPRLATNYGVLLGIPVPIDKPATSVFAESQPFDFGGAGLVSTPADFDRFLRLLLGDGALDGKRVVSAAAVRMGTSNLLPPGVDTRGTFIAGAGFGAGGRVGLGADEGSFGWSGAAGTIALIQRRIGLRAGLYAQFMPAETWPLQREFLAAARADSSALAHA